MENRVEPKNETLSIRAGVIGAVVASVAMTQINKKGIIDRNQSISWARNLMKHPDWLIMDTESTGLKKTDEIIQIGIVDPLGNAVFESYVNPVKRRISSEAKMKHGIDLKMLKDAPTYYEISPRLRDILNGKRVIAYNIRHEFNMFIQTAAKFEKVVDCSFRLECAMDAYAKFVGEWDDYHKDYKWQKLPGAKHGAIEDCLATLNIIKEMAAAELTPVPDPWWKSLFRIFNRARKA